MEEIYFFLVINQKRTCDINNQTLQQVPENLKNKVILLLNERGYDLNGNLII